MYVRGSDTVRTLKSKVQDKEGIPTDQQYLLYTGLPMEDSNTLAHYGVQPYSTILLLMQFRQMKPGVL